MSKITTNGDVLFNQLLTEDELLEVAHGQGLCDLCNKRVEKYLSPTNPVCEGKWCKEALEIWLEEEAISNE